MRVFTKLKQLLLDNADLRKELEELKQITDERFQIVFETLDQLINIKNNPKKKISFSLIERKSRVPQIQGVQGRSRNNLLRALGNEEDGVSSAFPQGKQNGVVSDKLCFTDAKVVNNLYVA